MNDLMNLGTCLYNSVSSYLFETTLMPSLIISSVMFVISMLAFLIKTNATKKRKLNELGSDIPYFRDIPCDNIEMALYLGVRYGVVDNLSDFIGAMLLKWIKEDKIDVVQEKDQTIIDMRKIFKTKIGFETKVYTRLLSCAGTERVLQENEFKNFFQDSQQTISDLFDDLKEEVEEDLIKQGLAKQAFNDAGFSEVILDNKLLEKGKQLMGLKKFLNDFSLMAEKESIEVHLWEEYLIYAQLFGIADQVSTQFQEIYPNFNEVVVLNYTKVILVASISSALTITAKAFMAAVISHGIR